MLLSTRTSGFPVLFADLNATFSSLFMTMTLATTSVIPVLKLKVQCAYLVQYQVQRHLDYARVSLEWTAQQNVFTFPWISS